MPARMKTDPFQIVANTYFGWGLGVTCYDKKIKHTIIHFYDPYNSQL